MTPYVLDTETNILNNSVGNMKASPYHPDNKIVALGYVAGEKYRELYHRSGLVYEDLAMTNWWMHAISEPIVLVGHNIGFDLLHIMKLAGNNWEIVSKNIYIWDTQQVAYLLSGHTHMYPSLDELCEQYGLPLKDDKIKEYWNDGVDTSDIPKGELLEYMKGDVLNTQTIFRKQLEEVQKDPRLFQLVKVKMEDLLSTITMEWNGMHFDRHAAHTEIVGKEFNVAVLETHIQHEVAMLDFHPEFEYNPRSLDHLSLALYGGKYEMDEDVAVLNEDGTPYVYKSGARKGQVKTKRVSIEYRVKGLGLVPTEEPNKKGIYSTRDEILATLTSVKLAKLTLDLRSIDKDLNTYYIGYSKLVWPDGKIHPSLNHCSTRTGRQSCSSPNLQNVSSKEE